MVRNRALRKILAGDEIRRSRFHDEAGHFCGVIPGFGIMPSAWSVAQAKLTGRWMRLPWWVWGAVSFVQRNLRSSDRVVEIGAGYSSLWLAKRCTSVLSVEALEQWIQLVRSMAMDQDLAQNLTIIHASARQGFERAMQLTEKPDVLVIDSESRKEIYFELLSLESVPRIVVYDDTDKVENRGIVQAGVDRGYSVHAFRGFKPQCLHVCETTVLVKEDIYLPQTASGKP